jgi:hypothetical protein
VRFLGKVFGAAVTPALVAALAVYVIVDAQVTVPFPNFTLGTTADPAQVNANFAALSNQALNRTGGTMTGTLTTQNVTPAVDATYTLGDGAHRYTTGNFSGAMTAGGAVTGGSFVTAGTTTFNSLAYTWPGAQTANYFLRTNGSGTLAWALPTQTLGTCDLRLTLETGVPVSTTDQLAKTSVFVTPVDGGQCAFYDGSAQWTVLQNSQVTISVPATTNTVYDVWCRNNAGTIACDTTAWTNDTARATALALQDNVRVKNGDTTRRFIGSFRTTGSSGQTEDSAAKRYVSSYYHRARRVVRVVEATDTWNYTLDAYQQARAQASNQVDVLVGWNDAALDVTVIAFAVNDTSDVPVWVSIGEDGTSPMSNVLGQAGVARPGSTSYQPVIARLSAHYPAVGRHFYTWLERSTASNTTTWAGDNGNAQKLQAGIFGWVEG